VSDLQGGLQTLGLDRHAPPLAYLPQHSKQWICGNAFIMERYLVELDGDQIELLKGMVQEAMKVADEKKIAELEALLSALGIMSWKAGDRRAD
jgi:hypothetical protein